LDYYCIDVDSKDKDTSLANVVKDDMCVVARDEKLGAKLMESAMTSRVRIAQEWFKANKKALLKKFSDCASSGLTQTDNCWFALNPIPKACVRNKEASKDVLAHLTSLIQSLGVKVNSLSFVDGTAEMLVQMDVSWKK
jgi:hypothetical protein